MSTETPESVDALPFVDTAIDQDEQKRDEAMRMVDDELEVHPPAKDYIEYLPDVGARPFKTQTVDSEHERLEHGNATSSGATALSEIKTDIPTPAHSAMDGEEFHLWNNCLDQVKVKLEYRQRQVTNLELLKSYGGPAWEQFIKQNEMMDANMKQELDELCNKVQDVNLERKNQQESTSRNLDVVQSQWDNLAVRNQMLAEEIEKLQQELQDLGNTIRLANS